MIQGATLSAARPRPFAVSQVHQLREPGIGAGRNRIRYNIER
jgi:hypothetical protein